jgi:hypothetical protein
MSFFPPFSFELWNTAFASRPRLFLHEKQSWNLAEVKKVQSVCAKKYNRYIKERIFLCAITRSKEETVHLNNSSIVVLCKDKNINWEE